MIKLGINIDHVATIRNARGEIHPDPFLSAKKCLEFGIAADQLLLRKYSPGRLILLLRCKSDLHPQGPSHRLGILRGLPLLPDGRSLDFDMDHARRLAVRPPSSGPFHALPDAEYRVSRPAV